MGFNDADYQVTKTVNGKKEICPYYSRWHNMLKRCYCQKTLKKRPSYNGCYVCVEWLTFSNFKSWMEKQDWQGKHLDKDILIQGNKCYSPKTCLFVTNEVNNIMKVKLSGILCSGVSFCNTSKKYKAYGSSKDKTIGLGSYDSYDEASHAYRVYKKNSIIELALKQEEPLRSAMINFKLPLI